MEPNYYFTPTPKVGGFSRKQIIIGAILGLAVLIGVILMLTSGGKSIGSQLQHLSLRLTDMQTLLSNTTVTRNLKNEELSKLVTEFSLNFNSDVNQLTPLMTEAGLPEKFDSAIVSAETDTSTPEKLQEATLNSKLDESYAEVLTIKIASLRALIAETYALTNNAKLRQALSSTDKHLNDTDKRLEKIEL